ncbi:helix-turn-helix transcriptional regulator [Sphingobacterium thalpophilum]|uniref:helix-turn-helix transcriptional regulator n=1 Tax=Sphingobacterium thalpophilum TaxID=259 RepID=UPI002D780B38|nr:helix-turn-helix domain-containing protein [Sphingobacterium thalpophilum]
MSHLEEIVLLLREINEKLSATAHHILSVSDREDVGPVDQLMTRMAVVSRLGISERTYNRWVKSGILRPICLGNKHYYREADLHDAIQRSIAKGLL